MQNRRGKNAQSAMEYLMTYGWAILIIAVVLGALYQLGVFNPASFQGKAAPGACQVTRPSGPNTTQLISLTGVCSGQEPQFVAQFNGATSVVNVPASNAWFFGSSPFTLGVWVKYSAISGSYWLDSPIAQDQGGGGQPKWIFGYDNSCNAFTLDLGVNGATHISSGCGTANILTGTWYYVVLTRSGNTFTWYLNGASIGTATSSASITSVAAPLTFGFAEGSSMSGSLANVQIYNSSLSSNEVKSTYIGGIGGAPIRLQNLVGWWPLNSNPNDYSGNLNNGAGSNVGYSNSWTNGYTVP